MKHLPIVDEFSKQPFACFVLAAALICTAIAFVCDWVPTSPNRPYFPGHQWFIALLCLALAMFFLYCALVSKRLERKK
jgi:ABC-type multidrug transport system permease subunit